MAWLMMALALAGATPPAADAQWKHADTGVVLPAQLGGMARTAVSDTTRTARDVTVRYEAPDKTLSAAMYVFRPPIADAGLWLDAALASLDAGQTFRNATRATAVPRAFSTGANRPASALRQVYSAAGVANRGIGLAYVPLGDWIVGIELSTKVLTASQLDARLQEVVHSVDWPAPAGAALPVARPVMACQTPLAFPASEAAPMMQGAHDSAAGKSAGARPGRTVWCREGDSRRTYGVYRPDSDLATYVLLLNESGGVVRVQATTQGTTYAVTLEDVDGNVSTLPAFTALPTPGQVWKLLGAAGTPAL